MAKTDSKIGTSIHQASELLRAGQLVAIPTETVYGLAGNALNAATVASIFEVKNRPSFDPLIIHLPHLDEVQHYVVDFPENLFELAKKFWPGPLTILLERNERIPDLITSGLPRVAIRVPAHPLTRQLLQSLPFPLAAPSANPFGYISPTSAMHVQTQLGNKIPYILDGGACTVGLESTIVGIENNKLTVYRKGGLAIEEINLAAGEQPKINAHSSSNPASPGMLKSHYAPRKPFYLMPLPSPADVSTKKKRAWLRFQHPIPGEHHQLILSPSGNLSEAAQNLFAFLRQLDNMEVDEIWAELVPEAGLGSAINDRLRRAAAR